MTVTIFIVARDLVAMVQIHFVNLFLAILLLNVISKIINCSSPNRDGGLVSKGK